MKLSYMGAADGEDDFEFLSDDNAILGSKVSGKFNAGIVGFHIFDEGFGDFVAWSAHDLASNEDGDVEKGTNSERVNDSTIHGDSLNVGREKWANGGTNGTTIDH